MRQFNLRVVEIATSGGQIHVRCEADFDFASAPGQIHLARADAPAQPFLRVPLLFNTNKDRLEFWLDSAHPYAALQPGDVLDCLGPCGRGFDLPAWARHLLLAGDSFARLLPLLHFALERRFAVTLLTPEGALLPDLPAAVEIQRGSLTAELVTWADVVAADVSNPESFARHVRQLRPNSPSGLMKTFIIPPMPCGTGACQACWVEVDHRRKLACLDGPVFPL
jgi:dihydroorotate dehydrogenase electron transfer subunit